jgi:FkbM family methyltransferase
MKFLLRFLCFLSRTTEGFPGNWRLRRYLYKHSAKIAGIGAFTATMKGGLKIEISSASSVNSFIEGAPIDTPAMRALEKLVHPSCCVIDVGANVGIISLALSRLAGKAGTVHAFEPVPEALELLRRNVVRNNCVNVTVYDCALSNQQGQVVFYDAGPGKSEVSSLRPRPGHQITVQAATLDSLMEKLRAVSVIKVDVEGAEYPVLDGARALLDRDKPHLVVEVSDKWSQSLGYRAADVCQLLRDHGYRLFVADRATLAEIDTPPEEQVDLIAVHASKAAAVQEAWPGQTVPSRVA